MNLPFGKKPQAATPTSAGVVKVPTKGHTLVKGKQTPPTTTVKALQTFEKGLTSVIDLIAPSSVEVDFRYLRVGDSFYTTLFIAGYPRYVSPGWLESVIDYDH